MQKFNMTRDINGYNGFGLPPSQDMFSGVIEAGVEQTVTVPESPYSDFPHVLAVFGLEPGSNNWVAYNQTAVAAAGSLASTNSELNPSARILKGGDVIHFITNDTSNEIGVSFYACI